MIGLSKKTSDESISLISLSEKHSNIAEQYRTIRSNIRFSSVDKPLKTMVITSPGPNEGKSTTAANMAIIFANSGKKVLLVDADLRKPSIAKEFNIPNAKGVSNYLIDTDSPMDQLIYQLSIDGLWVMPSGPIPPNPSELLSSKRMEELIQRLSEQFDLIIFDMPPIVTVADAQIVAAHTDGALLVIRENKTNKQKAIRAKQLLEIAKIRVIGVIYNGVSKNEASEYYYY